MNGSQEILNILIENVQKSGKTEKECLLASGINTSFLTDWKSGRMKSPSYDKIVRLANYLEIDLNTLFNEAQPTTPQNTVDKELLELIKKLSPEEKKQAKSFVKYLLSERSSDSSVQSDSETFYEIKEEAI